MNGKSMFYIAPVVAAALVQLKRYEPAAGTGGFLPQVPALKPGNPPFSVDGINVQP